MTTGPARRYAAALVQLACRPLAHVPDGTVSPNLDRLERLIVDRKVQLETVLEEVVAEAVAALGADRGTLYLVDKVRGELLSHVAELPELPQIRLRLGEGVAGWVAETGQLLNVPHGNQDPRFADHVDVRTGYRTESLLAVPLWAEGSQRRDPIGVLQLLNKRGGFTAADEQIIDGIAHRISGLLAHSSLASHLRGHPDRPLSFHFNHIVGDCEAMREVYRRVGRAAQSSATVLIRGESGTGKELVARAVHDNSARADRPFVVVDLAAMPAELIENELFGHVRGAYTGAHADARGRVQEAEGGTLFLDEIGELPLPLQARLLRLIQERSYTPVGAGARREADVRFVCATHRDLEAMVAERRFREDLYFRVRVVELMVPPLRSRGAADLDRLVDHFLYVFARRHGRPGVRISAAARAVLHDRAWPGNVRELQHCIESAVVIEEQSPLPASAFQTRLGAATRAPPAAAADRFQTALRPLREVEQDYLGWALAQCNGNRSAAARALEIGRNTLLRRLRDAD